MDGFIKKLLGAAKLAGIETAEVCYMDSDSFGVSAKDGEINEYEVSATRSLGLRGLVNGKMGYASTEAFDDAAIDMMVNAVLESAALNESEEQDEIFAGEETYPAVETPAADPEQATAEEKIAFVLEMEKAALQVDERIRQSQGASVQTSRGTLRIVNSMGLDLRREQPLGGAAFAFVGLLGQEGSSVVTGYEVKAAHRFSDLDAKALGEAAAEETLSKLNGSPVRPGVYRVIFRNDAMQSLLATFSGIFSAENAQQKLSLLEGREGETIASEAVTLMDDPLLPGGFASTPFDAEGSAARRKAVIEDGKLVTLLHNRKTAKKQGTATTGNAARQGVGGPIRVAPTNFFFKPGEKDLATLINEMDDGLLLTELGGLHAGANPISGDFSLIAKGYLIANGQRVRPVEQITVAGNFYQLLKGIRAVGSDLEFRGQGIGSPSVDVGSMNVSGAEQ